MLGQFAECLEQELGEGGGPGASGAVESTVSEPEAFDLGAAGQEAVLKRLGPVLVGLGLLAFLIWLIRR